MPPSITRKAHLPQMIRSHLSHKWQSSDVVIERLHTVHLSSSISRKVLCRTGFFFASFFFNQGDSFGAFFLIIGVDIIMVFSNLAVSFLTRSSSKQIVPSLLFGDSIKINSMTFLESYFVSSNKRVITNLNKGDDLL